MVLFFVSAEEGFKVLMYHLQKLVDLFSLGSHALFCSSYLLCRPLGCNFHAHVYSLCVEIYLVKKNLADLYNFVVVEAVVGVIRSHFKVRVNKVYQLINISLVHYDRALF